MQGKHFAVAFHIPGTLTANITPVFKAPFACQLVKVSAVGSNANDATLKVGTTSDDDAYIVETAVGDSNVPVEFDQDDFVGDEFPHIPDDTVILVTLDYNGAAGTAIADATIVLFFTEG